MKKRLIIVVIILLLITAGLTGLLMYNNQNNNSSTNFSLSEQQWIESNKNNIIDFYIPSDIDIFSHIGKGVFFDFLDSFTDYTNLKVNPIAYKITSESTDYNYAFALTDKVAKNQLLVYEDSFVYISSENKTLSSISDLSNLTIGVLENDVDIVSSYLANDTINYVTYSSIDEIEGNYEEGSNSSIDGFIILKSFSLNMLFDKELYINYHLTNLTKKYVLTLNGQDILNSILKKYYQRWFNDNFTISYNNHLLSEYFNYNNITEIEKNSLQEKKYTYGFVPNGAYDLVADGKLNGINYSIIKSFATFANIDMDYNDSYLSYDELINDFNNDKVDLFFNNGNYKVKMPYYETNNVIKSNIVILSSVKKPIIINDFKDLTGKTISVVKNSKIAAYLNNNNNINIKTYNSMDKLLKNLNKDSIVAIDLENYEYYKDNDLVNYKIVYQYLLDENYNYIVNKNDEIFYQLFNFYLSYNAIDEVIITGYSDIYSVEKDNNILFILVIVLTLILTLELIGHLRTLIKAIKTKAKHTLSKNDKLKYIDPLTSLKNRLYLNDSIEAWDNSSVYPQSIIIISINDLSEINGNFGYEEGDKVILEAANVLIRTQLPNTEIIRTDGSEFLIYMIEYDEKQTAAYLRKLNKELKELSHGYGAVTGYSMITDGIKTIDDAINEATLDVKTNKELAEENIIER